MKIDKILEKYPELDSSRAADLKKELLGLFSVSENTLNNDIELELRQKIQELPDKTTAGEKLYYEVGWREGYKHIKMLISYYR